jgi:hypothetical protein
MAPPQANVDGNRRHLTWLPLPLWQTSVRAAQASNTVARPSRTLPIPVDVIQIMMSWLADELPIQHMPPSAAWPWIPAVEHAIKVAAALEADKRPSPATSNRIVRFETTVRFRSDGLTPPGPSPYSGLPRYRR